MILIFSGDENTVLTQSEGRRKSYIITDSGREELQKEYQRLKTLVLDGGFYFEK